MATKEAIANLMYEARQRREDLEEGADLFQDRSNWAAYVRQQLGEGPELSLYEAGNTDSALNSIDGIGDRLICARELYSKDVNRLSDIRRNMAGPKE